MVVPGALHGRLPRHGDHRERQGRRQPGVNISQNLLSIVHSHIGRIFLSCNHDTRDEHERRAIMKDKIVIPLFVAIVISVTSPLTAAADSWQEKMLFNPTPAQLEVEKSRSRIMIYNGLKDTQIVQAMDRQFDRIEHMMFTGTQVTDKSGEVIIDPDTGEARVEDDGC
jgi:hypothetical protein